ncbi:MAG: fructose-6-phosphate aldolase [Bradymonadaceae bacterium]
MDFFVDTADIDEVRRSAAIGVLDGVTTNPSLVAETGRQLEDVVLDICEIVDGPVSVEVTATDTEPMVDEAREYADWADNVVIKCPLTPDGLEATNELTDGIDVNVTLCFSANQALLAANAGATYISPFIGRLDDIGNRGMDVVETIVAAYGQDPEIETEVLAASIRHPQHVTEAAVAGADVATVPPSVIEQMFQHPKTDLGLERFLEDWKDAQSS